MDVAVTYSHPGRAVSPNASGVHWTKKAQVKRLVRDAAFVLTRAARRSFPGGECFLPMSYSVIWFYKGMKPDADNCLACCKAILDGAADAWGINDRAMELNMLRRVHTLGDKAGTVVVVYHDYLPGWWEASNRFIQI